MEEFTAQIEPDSQAPRDVDREGWTARCTRWAALALVAAVTAAYANSFRGVMLLDDRYIEKTPALKDPTLWGALKESSRPLVDLSYSINREIGGLEPLGYHVFNLLVHLAATLAMFGLTRRSLAAPGVAASQPSHRPIAGAAGAAIALWWALHPLQTQSVTYISQRAESMMGLFYLLTLYCVARAAGSDRATRWRVAAVVSCVLGMLCKQVMVTAPAIALIYDRAFWSSSWRQTLRGRWKLHAGLFATLGFLLFLGVAGEVVGKKGGDVGFGVASITPRQYFLTQFGVVAHYLRLALWPNGLCLDHQWRVAHSMAEAAVPAAVVTILLVLTMWAWVRRPAAGFLGVAFFLILLPTSSFIPIKDVIFEHRMYLPLAPVVAAAVLGGHWVLRRMVTAAANEPMRSRRIETGLILAVALALGVLTHFRNRDYSSGERMWSGVVARYPNSARALNNLGAAYLERGELEAAEEYCRRAVAADPSMSEAQYNLGHALMLMGRVEEAIGCLSAAAKDAEAFPEALLDLGTIYVSRHWLDSAISCFREAVRARPDHADAHFNLGCALRSKGDRAGAIREFREVLRIRPGDEEAQRELAAIRRNGQD